MSPSRAKAIFEAALQQPAGQAGEFVRSACGDDGILLAEVRRMLAERESPTITEAMPVELPVFAAGQVIAGRYRIVRYISRGGMGEVYEAEDLELREHVALKTLLPKIASDQAMIARFKQEIQLSRKIGHPNVCRVFDLARHTVNQSSGESTVFLTMEFLGGETLSARLHREGRLSTEAALPLVEQMAEALGAAHRAGVIHRDFKPSNVMLAPAGDGVRAVVTDFGLARKSVTGDDSTASLPGKVMGTLDYMAPELLTGSSASFGSDVYALGMVAYEMVAGRLPFDCDSLSGAILRSKQAVPSPRSVAPDLSPNWERAILRALDADPLRRFSSASQFVQAIRGETVPAGLARQDVMRKGILLVAVILMLVGGWMAWKGWARYHRRPPAEALALYRKGLDDIHAGAYWAATRALQQALQIAPGDAMAHVRLAEALVELEMPEKAGQEMLVARRQDLSGLPQLERLQVDAIDLRITREFAAAVGKYEQVLALAGADDGDLSVDLGRAYENAAQAPKAVAAFRRAAEGTSHNPAAWLHLAMRYSRDSDTPKSEEAFRQAEQLYSLTSNLEGLTEVAFQRGVAANRLGKLDEGASYLKKAIESAKMAGNIQQEVRAKLQLANNAYTAGDAALAERYAREALGEAQANQLETQAIVGLVNLGNAFRRKPDFAGAERYYQDALALARSNNSPRFVALGLLSLAGLHDQVRRPEDTAREAGEALAYFQSNHWSQETFQCLTLLGRAQSNRGDYQGAVDSFRRLLEAAEKSQNKAQRALAHEALGAVFEVQQRYPEALTQYRNYLELSADPEHTGYAASSCANALWHLGRYAEAAAMFDQADGSAAKFAALRISIASSRARMELSREHYAQSAQLAAAALAADTSHTPARSAALKTTLGMADFAGGKKAEGIRICLEGLLESDKANDPGALLEARLAVALIHLETGRRDEALNLLHQVEPTLGDRIESRWRAFALLSRADPQYGARARQALDVLAGQLGTDAFSVYLTRPDVQRLSRPSLQPSPPNR